MLKSGDRTKEVSVMEMEGWSLVDCMNMILFAHNRDYEYDQKGRSKKGVMPHAKGENNLCG